MIGQFNKQEEETKKKLDNKAQSQSISKKSIQNTRKTVQSDKKYPKPLKRSNSVGSINTPIQLQFSQKKN